MESPVNKNDLSDGPPPIPSICLQEDMAPPPLPFSLEEEIQPEIMSQERVATATPIDSIEEAYVKGPEEGEKDEAPWFRKGPFQWSCILSFFVVQFVLGGYFFGQSDKFHNTHRVHAKALKRVMGHKGSPKYRLVPDRKGQGIWLASNQKGPQWILVEFVGTPGDIMSTREVRVRASGAMKEGRLYLNKFDVLAGNTFAPGVYKVKLKAYPSVGVLNKNIDWQKPNILTTTFYYYPGSKRALKKRLKKFKNRVAMEMVNPLRDRLQGYRTYNALLLKVEGMLGRYFSGRSPNVRGFENAYNTEVGPILQRLILDNNRQHISLMNSRPAESLAFDKLLRHGKDIGMVASEMARLFKTKPHRSHQLSSQFKKRLRQLQQSNMLELKQLQAELDYFGPLKGEGL